jgi:hypothetical protein
MTGHVPKDEEQDFLERNACKVIKKPLKLGSLWRELVGF